MHAPGRASRTLGFVALSWAALIVVAASEAEAARITITFAEMASEPIDDLTLSNLTFDYKIDGVDSDEAIFGGAIGRIGVFQALTGPNAGVLTLDFVNTTRLLEFDLGAYLDDISPVGSATVELFGADLTSFSTTEIELQNFGAEAFSHDGDPVRRAVISFSDPLPTFYLDNLTFSDVLETLVHFVGLDGAEGTIGTTGDPGGAGGRGTDGEDAVAFAQSGDPTVTATAIGGTGGRGGRGGFASSETATSGMGGQGGDGGDADATANAVAEAPDGAALATATAIAGSGGASGLPGSRGVQGALGTAGIGGEALATATATSESGPATAIAIAHAGSGQHGTSISLVDAASGSTSGPLTLIQEATAGSGTTGGRR